MHGENMTIGEKLIESLEIKTVFEIELGTLVIPVTETVILSWIVMAALVVAALLATRKFETIPRGVQAIVEAAVEFLDGQAAGMFGRYANVYSSYLGTVFFFLLLANTIPAITPVFAFGYEPFLEIKPPTRDINVAAALALISILMVLSSGVVVRGPKRWLKSLFEPMPFMLPFNLLEYIIKPMTLCLRLFGNILGAFILMSLADLALAAAIGTNLGVSILASLYFDFFDGFIQAMIFTFLTMIYISEAIKSHDA